MKYINSSFGLAAVIALGLASGASAQDYPNKRITFVVGFAAGGYGDTVGRLIGDYLSKVLGQTVVVENRPGAASNTAARYVASARPDGYTVLVTTTAVAANATLYKSLDYSLLKDFIPVAVPVEAPEQLASSPSKAKTLKEFLESAKAVGKSYSSAGVGSGSHLAMADFFANHAKVNAEHVPFQGGAPALQAAVGGHVDATAATASGGTVTQVSEGRLVCLGIAAAKRYKNLPECPTFTELGYPGFEATSWVGFFVPAGTPAEVVTKLNDAINSAVADPEVAAKLTASGQPVKRSASEAAAFVKSEVESWGARVKAAKLSIE
jgi:tripartite-type tricarboxylate transporter receptor subunit TctC